MLPVRATMDDCPYILADKTIGHIWGPYILHSNHPFLQPPSPTKQASSKIKVYPSEHKVPPTTFDIPGARFILRWTQTPSCLQGAPSTIDLALSTDNFVLFIYFDMVQLEPFKAVQCRVLFKNSLNTCTRVSKARRKLHSSYQTLVGNIYARKSRS